jgi:hypothetical protein
MGKISGKNKKKLNYSQALISGEVEELAKGNERIIKIYERFFIKVKNSEIERGIGKEESLGSLGKWIGPTCLVKLKMM